MEITPQWFWAIGQCPSADMEFASYQLFEAGAGAVEELDAPSPEVARFRFWCATEVERDALVAALPAVSFEVGTTQAQDWEKQWRESRQPVQVSPRLWVRPPWVEHAGEPGQVVLAIDAKMAFGTGEHESTSLCCTLMEGLDWEGRVVLDIGAGTGILGMFALRLGASRAVLTEIDPVCAPCIQENYVRNSMGVPEAVLGGLEVFRGRAVFQVVLCNMIRSEVWPLRADIARLLAPEGFLVLSGQLASEKQPVLDWFAEQKIQVHSQVEKGEWWAVCGRTVQ